MNRDRRWWWNWAGLFALLGLAWYWWQSINETAKIVTLGLGFAQICLIFEDVVATGVARGIKKAQETAPPAKPK
jgi:hypothetical protein